MLYYENPNQKSVIIDYWLSIYDDKLTKRLDTTESTQYISSRYNHCSGKNTSNNKQHYNLKNFSSNTIHRSKNINFELEKNNPFKITLNKNINLLPRRKKLMVKNFNNRN
jgi:hypothetical protein